MNSVQCCSTGLDKSASCTAKKSASQQDDPCGANVDRVEMTGLWIIENEQRPREIMDLTNN